MNIRVNKLAAAVLVVCLSVTAPSAYAASRSESGPFRFFDRVQRLVQTVKKAVIKAVVSDDHSEDGAVPRPPIG